MNIPAGFSANCVEAKDNKNYFDVQEYIKKLNNIVPQNVVNYAKDKYREFCEVAEEDINRKIDYKSLKIGKGFFIYDVERRAGQISDFYFKITDDVGLVGVIEIVETNQGMECVFSDSLNYILSSNDTSSGFYYRENGVINYMDCSSLKNISKFSLDETIERKEFKSKSLIDKLKIMYYNTKTLKVIDISDYNAGDGMQEGYTPNFSVDTQGKKVCNTGNYMVDQEGKEICWAACVASIYNYFYNKHITAKQVSKNVIGGYKGASYKTVLKAFSMYNMDIYKHTDYSLKYNQIKTNISHMRLPCMTGYNQISSHDIVLTGYAYTNNNEKIKVYDPAENAWKWLEHHAGKTVFSSNGDVYRWGASYYVYK